MAASQEFTTFYLQRTTQEFAEDLDKVREADDFKAESLPFLIHALKQGTALYSSADQARVVRPAATATTAAEDEDGDVDMEEPQPEKETISRKKEKSKRKKSST
ncbi:uncharacterized protein CTRU02_208918 [Colletotrichum truncatum]|uniref:Uncharacterized protein n=1 Tax=Colletotrichum truncatum TaxID=5467 RepID=A0ACC3YXM3_COLTU|nr:uncharacterized protein CTRU02_07890 [Colletotrichum truncatum]KAF6790984.1 hypothetical protein CTRU02_07890 [Colletotrichum truncatum]